MSIWFSEVSDDEQKKVNEATSKGLPYEPIVKREEPSAFSGSLSAPLRGAAAGFAKVADVVATPFDAVADRLAYTAKDLGSEGFIEPYSEFKQTREDKRDKLVLGGIEALEDKENTGAVGRFAYSISDYVTRGVIGSALGGIGGAAVVTGGSESNYVYKDLTSQGVDEDIALTTSIIDGMVSGLSTALPLSYAFKGTGGLVADAALSVGSATGISTAGQVASGAVLKSGGYDKQAQKYDVTWESLSTELVLNGLLFGAGRYASTRLNNDIDAEIDSISVQDIEARNTEVQATLAVNELQLDNIAPVTPKDAIQANNHLKNIDTALEQIKSGRPVNVPYKVQGEKKKAPINYDTMPLAGQGRTIARRAQQEGVDPSVALTISHLETGGRFNPSAKNKSSTAHGVFQVLDRTWRNLGGGNRNDVNEQIRIGLKHIKMANNYINKNLGRPPVAHEQYLGHLLGPAGAVKVLKADPKRPLIDVVREYDPKYANAIVNNNGMKGLTVGQAIGKWENKWNNLSSRYGGAESTRSTAIAGNGMPVDVAYEVRDIRDLLIAFDKEGRANPDSPIPYDRTAETTMARIDAMANDLDIGRLGDSIRMSDGAPIIGMDNFVESGNVRTAAIGRAYESGNADAYRSFVQGEADRLGLDISDIEQPVLVRTRTSDIDRTQLADLVNSPDELPAIRLPQDQNSRIDYDYDAIAQFIQNRGSRVLQGEIAQLPRTMDTATGIETTTFVDNNGTRNVLAVRDGNIVGQARIEPNTGKVDYTSSPDSPDIESVISSRANEYATIETAKTTASESGFGASPEEQAALDIIMANPDQPISVSRKDPDGNVEEITMTLRERLNELQAEAEKAQQDVLATQTAISCALKFGG